MSVQKYLINLLEFYIFVMEILYNLQININYIEILYLFYKNVV
ncbi:hypothetical protein RUMHYD_02205 [Blautia hydrogenotrophica DSM 10507]|uniref:Uncharacterized protein n=1 Tax=Blautia hydrogenotrophica (strain DSM 10507 / JCM 14656 / S5a33) TaxID=476272 RepID=C0CMW7_BLAHS|nr:hypothetical protein RUMHYD_02205 [Blautia hydrogenotrophica DSM 10507]